MVTLVLESLKRTLVLESLKRTLVLESLKRALDLESLKRALTKQTNLKTIGNFYLIESIIQHQNKKELPKWQLYY